MTDKPNTIEQATHIMESIAHDIRYSLTPETAKTVEMWVNTNMNPDWMDLAAVSAFLDAAHMMQQYLDAYQLRESALNKERIEKLEARIEELTGEVTHD